MGDNMHHARQGFRFTDIQAGDQRVSVRAAQHFNDTGIGRNAVFHIARFCLHHYGSIGFRRDFPDNGQVITEGRCIVSFVVRIFAAFYQQINDFIELLITGVTAEQTGKGIINLVAIRLRYTFNKISQDQGRRRVVITGLDHTHIDHRLLNITQFIPFAEGFGGFNHCAFQLGSDQQ